MKITPVTSGSGQPGTMAGNAQIGQSASPERKERAKKVLMGESPLEMRQSETPVEPDLSRLQKPTIKMKTNATIDRFGPPPQEQFSQAQEPANPDPNVSTQEPAATQPLSPMAAALAKQKRALQAKERELAEREKKLSEVPAQTTQEQADWKSQLKADPLARLQEAGVTYDDLTQAILGKPQSQNVDVESIKKDLLKAIKEDVNNDFKQRDDTARKQVVAQMTREAQFLANQGNSYELVRMTKSVPDAIELIERTFDKTGEILEVSEALKLVEEELISELTPIAKANKIQSRLNPSPTLSQHASQAPQQGMRTLTSRDGSTAPIDKKERARLAFWGQLKK